MLARNSDVRFVAGEMLQKCELLGKVDDLSLADIYSISMLTIRVFKFNFLADLC